MRASRIRELARSGVAWSALEAGVSASLSFASAFAVARIVGPAEFGAGAAIVAVHLLLWVGVNALFADALVQRRALDEAHASSALWASVAVGLVGAAIQAGSGLLLARCYADPRLLPMALLLAVPLPLVGAGGVAQGLLTRKRAYRSLALRAVVGQGLGTVVGIGLAGCGAGAWAVVAQQGTTSAAGALVLLVRARWEPGRALRWSAVGDLLRTGLPLTASTLVQQGRYRIFALLIAGTAGPAALGVVHLAFRLVDAVRDLALTALWRLLLPAMSERQHDLAALQRCVDRHAFLAGLVLFPVTGAMLASLRPVVLLVLGPAWSPAADAAVPLLLLMAWVFLGFAGGVALVARGGARHALLAQLGATVAVVAGVLLLRPTTPLAAAWIWFAAQTAMSPYLILMTARSMQAGWFRQHRPGLAPLALAAAATTTALCIPPALQPVSPLGLIVVRLAIVAAFYSAGLWSCLRPALRSAWPRAVLAMEPG